MFLLILDSDSSNEGAVHGNAIGDRRRNDGRGARRGGRGGPRRGITRGGVGGRDALVNFYFL